VNLVSGLVFSVSGFGNGFVFLVWGFVFRVWGLGLFRVSCFLFGVSGLG